MKTVVSKKELSTKIDNIQKVLKLKRVEAEALPILGHCLFVSENGDSYISATDLEFALREPITVDTKESGSVCIPARKLLDIIKALKGDISLESVSDKLLEIKSGNSTFRLETLPAEEFPLYPTFEETEEMEIDSLLLLKMIEKTIYATGENDVRYAIQSLLFHVKPSGQITVVGTDGHRMALFEGSLTIKTSKETKMIVPRKAAIGLMHLLKGASRPVRITTGENSNKVPTALFEIEKMQFLTRLLEGNYPDYKAVIPTKSKNRFTADKDLLANSLKSAFAIYGNKKKNSKYEARHNPVILDIADGRMVVSTPADTDTGTVAIRDEVPIRHKGELLRIAFNAQYLIQALNAIESQRVVFTMDKPLSPTIIKGKGEHNYKCIVMPLNPDYY